MKRKRLDHDIWWKFDKINYRYYQMRVEIEEFHGYVGLIELIDGQYQYWDMTITGKTAVLGEGMNWLQLIPDGKKHVISARYLPENKISLWYVDVIESIEHDTDGMIVFLDKYVDVTFTPKGEVIIADCDELDEAHQSGELTKEQYDEALGECDLIIEEYCSDIIKTEKFCLKILAYVNDRINSGEKQFNSK